MVVIMMGRKRKRHAWWMASSGASPFSRSASRAKSIIMMAFFLTMPMSRMMPMSAITLNSIRQMSSASKAPTPAEGKLDRMVMGWI